MAIWPPLPPAFSHNFGNAQKINDIRSVLIAFERAANFETWRQPMQLTNQPRWQQFDSNAEDVLTAVLLCLGWRQPLRWWYTPPLGGVTTYYYTNFKFTDVPQPADDTQEISCENTI